MRDIAATAGAVKMARLCIFDEVAGTPLASLLAGEGPLDTAALKRLIDHRTSAA